MFSTPELNEANVGAVPTKHAARCLLALAVCAIGFGCQDATTHVGMVDGKPIAVPNNRAVRPVIVKTPAPVSAQPAADEATEVRNWHRTAALYHSGATQAWPMCEYYYPSPDMPDALNYIADPVMMVVQTASLPVTLVTDYPGNVVWYYGDVVPYSYNAMPPLPPEPTMSALIPDPDPLIAPADVVAVLPRMPLVPEEQPNLIVTPETAPATSTAPATTRRIIRRPVAATQPEK